MPTNQILTLQQIENLFQSLTMQILGLPTRDINNNLINQDKVRISWPTGGAPAWKITEDICFVRITPTNDPIIQQRDITYNGYNSGNVNRAASYTRNHNVQWTIYGPNSFENADNVRNGIFLPEVKEILDVNNLALITVVNAPMRAPELFSGNWWQRCDVAASFNEGVLRYGTIPVITEVLAGTEINIRKG